VSASEQAKLHIAREIIFSLVAGVAITLLLAVLRAVPIAPGVTDLLLRPGLYLDHEQPGKGILSAVVPALVDGIVYGLLAFVVIHLRSRRSRPLSRAPGRGDRRCECRVQLTTPIFVYGWLADEPFSENTETLNVSATGALIPLSAKVVPSQALILTNLQTNEDLPCRVSRSFRTEDGKTLAGLTFLQTSPSFWQINFVPRSAYSSIEPHS
jgi:hypothetical protein